MNPYVLFAIAMCGIVLLSLGATAYLAARFNRAAKRDLAAALGPLAAVLDGNVDLEEARVTGRYAGHLAIGGVVRTPNGMGRMFQTEIVDSAGGESWSITRERDATRGEPRPSATMSTHPDIDAWYASHASEILPAIAGGDGGYRVEYAADAGALRLSRPMQARRDLPSAEAFRTGLDVLVSIGPVNRAAQGAPDADWMSGRSTLSSGVQRQGAE